MTEFLPVKGILLAFLSLFVCVQSMRMPLHKPKFLNQKDLKSACKSNDTDWLAKVLLHKKLNLVPCVEVAIKNKSFDVLEVVLKDKRLGDLAADKLQEVAGLAVLHDHLGAFEAALVHPQWSFAVECFHFMKSLDEFGSSLVFNLWITGKVRFYEALLRLKWQDCQRFIYSPVASHFSSQMLGALERFMISDPQVLITDVLFAMQMGDEELRGTLTEFMLEPKQKRRVYLSLLETFLRINGEFRRLKSTEKLTWAAEGLPKYLEQDVTLLRGFTDFNAGLTFAHGLAAKNCRLFDKILTIMPLVTKGEIKVGVLEFLIGRFLEQNEALTFIAAQLRTALCLAIINQGILRALRLTDLGPVIGSHL
jgi:hypothetical protein